MVPPPYRRGSPYEPEPIGWVESSLTDRAMAPCKGDDGAPDAWLPLLGGLADG